MVADEADAAFADHRNGLWTFHANPWKRCGTIAGGGR
jgi:hypothetical protein